MLPAAASPAQRFSVADRLASEIARRKESYRVAGHRLPFGPFILHNFLYGV
jgi:hypothetical protein